MSIMHTIKMAWMMIWRLAIVSYLWMPSVNLTLIIFGSFAVAAFIRYVLKMNVKTFPILRIFTKKSLVQNLKNSDAAKQKYAKVQDAERSADIKISENDIIKKASSPGKMTGFEPRQMDQIDIPSTPYMRGVPGVGLDSAAHMSVKNVRTGQMGETNFAKALSVVTVPGMRKNNTIIENIHSFWSVAMPSENDPSVPDHKYGTDIDSILISGDNIILVDTKFYTSGDVRYVSKGNQLFCIDNQTGKYVGKPRKMTRNMLMALERFKKHYPDMNVSAAVVLMPTNSGTPSHISAQWPGEIPATGIKNMIQGLIPVVKDSGLSVKNDRVLTNLSMLRKR